MRTAYLKVLVAITAGTPVVAMAQSAPSEVVAPAPVTSAPVKSTLFKVGTGLTRGFAFGGYSGLTVPVVLGVEHHLTPAISLYGNLFGGFNIVKRRIYTSSLLRDVGADAGIRYYYNQEKRQQKGRATGPFVGNYFALHSASSLYTYARPNSFVGLNYLVYDYSTLDLLWGMQRRIGGHGLLDAYAGAGLANPYQTRYQDGVFQSDRRPRLHLEAGVKLSLVP